MLNWKLLMVIANCTFPLLLSTAALTALFVAAIFSAGVLLSKLTLPVEVLKTWAYDAKLIAPRMMIDNNFFIFF